MNAFLTEFQWLRPFWLFALLPVLILLGVLLRTHFQSQQWHKYIAPELLPTLLDGPISHANRWLLGAIAAGWVAACIVLAGPVWQKQPTPVVQSTQALVICWDLSPSMLAQDISPSRLARSRLKIIDLLKAREDGQTALIAYSGEAYTVTPLTDDIQTIINLLPALGPTTLPSVGSNPEMAFEQAIDLLNQAGVSRGQILMLTDEITDDAIESLNSLTDSTPHQLTLWGVGSTDGAPIPLPKGGFAKDSAGNMVLVKLNEAELRDFATQSGSYYVPMVTNNSDISTLKQLLTGTPANGESSETDQLFDQWIESGHWLIWLCLPLLALGFRRGWLMVIALFISPTLAFIPIKAEAQNSATDVNAAAVVEESASVNNSEGFSNSVSLNSKGLQTALAKAFQTRDQQGYGAYQTENYQDAANRFEDSNWKASALYRNGQYAEAAVEFAKDKSANGDFNSGNAELLNNNVDEAIKAFKSALEKQPDWAEAQKNLSLAEQLKEQQEQQNQDQQNQDGEQQDSDQQDSQQSDQEQNSQDQESQNQQSQEQSQEQESQDQQNQQENQSAQQSSQNGQTGDESSEGQASSEANAMQEGSSSSGGQDNQEMQAMQPSQGDEEPQTEEEQRLEQALRKVSDDPAGLLRNKFNYQYRQRQQKINRGAQNPTQRAEQRW